LIRTSSTFQSQKTKNAPKRTNSAPVLSFEEMKKQVEVEFISNPKFTKFCEDLLLPHLAAKIPLSEVSRCLDASSTLNMYCELLEIGVLRSLLPPKTRILQDLRDQSDLLLYLHPMFTPNGVSLCPFRVVEVMAEIYTSIHHLNPKYLLTTLDATLIGRGGLCGTRHLTPYSFLFIPPSNGKVVPFDYIPLGFFQASDDSFPIKRNCVRVIEFHTIMYENKEEITVHLSNHSSNLSLERLIVLDKSCLESCGITEKEGKKLFLCTVCNLLDTKELNLRCAKGHDSSCSCPLIWEPTEEWENSYVTVFHIKAKNVFDDLFLHCKKRITENLCDRLLRGICSQKVISESEISAKQKQLEDFQNWIQRKRKSLLIFDNYIEFLIIYSSLLIQVIALHLKKTVIQPLCILPLTVSMIYFQLSMMLFPIWIQVRKR
jgi:hypothetical protein